MFALLEKSSNFHYIHGNATNLIKDDDENVLSIEYIDESTSEKRMIETKDAKVVLATGAWYDQFKFKDVKVITNNQSSLRLQVQLHFPKKIGCNVALLAGWGEHVRRIGWDIYVRGNDLIGIRHFDEEKDKLTPVAKYAKDITFDRVAMKELVNFVKSVYTEQEHTGITCSACFYPHNDYGLSLGIYKNTNVIMGLCLGCWGICLCTGIGSIITELALKGATDIDLESTNPCRKGIQEGKDKNNDNNINNNNNNNNNNNTNNSNSVNDDDGNDSKMEENEISVGDDDDDVIDDVIDATMVKRNFVRPNFDEREQPVCSDCGKIFQTRIKPETTYHIQWWCPVCSIEMNVELDMYILWRKKHENDE